jgi:hypothetical protein
MMKTSAILLFAILAATGVAAQTVAPPSAESADAVKGGDPHLVQSVRVVEDRIGAIIQVSRASGLVAVRADEPTRAADARARALAVLPVALAAARGRAWRDLGLGAGTEPRELVDAVEGDLPGMTLDAARTRLLVDPLRLPNDVSRGDPDQDADASVVLATGVAPDEPVAGHYIAHALMDAAPFDRPPTTDAFLARAALSEGSANLAALVLLFGGVGLGSEVVSGAVRPEDVLGGRLVPGALRSSSAIVARLLEFVYLDGFAQSAALARKGGFPRLAQERASRRATRDVLHVDLPAATPVVLSEPSIPAAAGLSLVDRDSLGEQGIVTLVSLVTGKDNLGMIAGEGWLADSLWRLEPAQDSGGGADNGATLWITRWTADEHAKDFSYSLERCLQARFPGEALLDDPVRGGQVLRRADRIYRLNRAGSEVTMTVATPAIDAKLGPETKKKAPSRPPAASRK